MVLYFKLPSVFSIGLYQKFILQSGTALATWSLYSKAAGRALTSAFSVAAGCFRLKDDKTLECLQKLKAEEFGKVEQQLLVSIGIYSLGQKFTAVKVS